METLNHRSAGITRQDLIDLAIEYGMVRSTLQFNELNKMQQQAILRQIIKLV